MAGAGYCDATTGLCLCDAAHFGDACQWESCPKFNTSSLPGLLAEYFTSATLSGKFATLVSERVLYDWGYGSPLTGIGNNGFSVRWSGTVRADTTGNHTLRLTGRGRFSLIGDGVRFFTQGTNSWSSWDAPTVWLTQGDRYDIIVEHMDSLSDWMAIELLWRTPGASSFVTIPGRNLQHSANCSGGCGERGCCVGYGMTRLDPL